ncbi:MAG: M48 family metallopeptidase [Pseudobdellovibrio sp.]
MDGILISENTDRQNVKITLQNQVLYVTDVNTSQNYFNLPVSSVTLSLGGNNDGLLFIESGFLGTNSLYVSSKRENLDYLKTSETLRAQVELLQKTNRSGAYLTASVLIGVLFVLIGLYVFRSPLAKGVSYLVPFSAEKKIADALLVKQLKPEQEQVLSELKKLVHRLEFKTSDKIWNERFHFHIASHMETNAYATVGGHIFINKGLILAVSRPEDLLGVVAHEMVHVKNRHVIRSVAQAVGVYTVLAFLFGDITGIGAVLVDQGGPLLSLSYSRDLEEEADEEALRLLVQNNIDPVGLADALNIIYQEQAKLLSQSPTGEIMKKVSKISWLNSHPEIEQRISFLKAEGEEMRREKNLEPVNFDFEKFKVLVKENF